MDTGVHVMSPLEEQSEAIFSQLLEHGSNGAELTRNSELRLDEVKCSACLEGRLRSARRRRIPKKYLCALKESAERLIPEFV